MGEDAANEDGGRWLVSDQEGIKIGSRKCRHIAIVLFISPFHFRSALKNCAEMSF